MKIDSSLLKTLRARKNWSQEQLAEECGLSLRTIQRLENDGKASIESVRALSTVFDIDPEDLFIKEKNEARTPIYAVKKGLREFANFSGTATRSEYWWFFLFVVLILAISTILHEKAYQVVALILLLPFLSASMRRLNDTNQSGWYLLLFFVPFGQIVVFYLLAQTNDTHQGMGQGLETA